MGLVTKATFAGWQGGVQQLIDDIKTPGVREK
jgi:hypothetical protein